MFIWPIKKTQSFHISQLLQTWNQIWLCLSFEHPSNGLKQWDLHAFQKNPLNPALFVMPLVGVASSKIYFWIHHFLLRGASGLEQLNWKPYLQSPVQIYIIHIKLNYAVKIPSPTLTLKDKDNPEWKFCWFPLKANVSRDNRVLCHVLSQFSIFLL